MLAGRSTTTVYNVTPRLLVVANSPERFPQYCQIHGKCHAKSHAPLAIVPAINRNGAIYRFNLYSVMN